MPAFRSAAGDARRSIRTRQHQHPPRAPGMLFALTLLSPTFPWCVTGDRVRCGNAARRMGDANRRRRSPDCGRGVQQSFTFHDNRDTAEARCSELAVDYAMIFGVTELICTSSQLMALRPGDVNTGARRLPRQAGPKPYRARRRRGARHDGLATSARSSAGVTLARITTSEFAGLRAIVTGGASGIGLATAMMLAERVRRWPASTCNRTSLPRSSACAATSGTTARSAPRSPTLSIASAVSTSSLTTRGSASRARSQTTPTRSGCAATKSTCSASSASLGPPSTPCAIPTTRRSSTRARSRRPPGCRSARATRPRRAPCWRSRERWRPTTWAKASASTACNPGTADTPWVQRLLDQADDPAAERAALNARQPIGRLVSADEVAAAICYLASPLAASTTGTDLAVDGGMQGLRVRQAPAPTTTEPAYSQPQRSGRATAAAPGAPHPPTSRRDRHLRG